jgi:hypothetical protein
MKPQLSTLKKRKPIDVRAKDFFPKTVGATGFEPKPKTEANKKSGWHDRGTRLPAFCTYRSEVRSGIGHGTPRTRFTGFIRHRPLRVSPSRMTKSVRPSIRTRVGNKLGTVLATSAPCGHNAKTTRRRCASLGFAGFKHHRNLFPMRRRWQTRRTQIPVLCRTSVKSGQVRYW